VKKFLVFLVKLLCYVVFFIAIFCISAYGGYLYITPSSYVTLNGGTSVVYTVNCYNRVLDVNIVNEDNKALDKLKLTHKDIADAIELTVQEFDINDNSQTNKYSTSISVSGEDEYKADRLAEKLNKQLIANYEN
jgi:hypothetical protein